MKKVIVFLASMFVGSVSAFEGMVIAPWECMSTTEPVDTPVLRVEKGYYIYDCLWNGDGDGDDGEGDGDE